MAELTGKQWRVETNIKGAPNSQGTLFQGGYPTRYPRHYTPERREMVTNAVNLDPSIRPGGNQGRPSANDWAARNAGEYAIGLDNVARSSVPVEHLAGLTMRFAAHPGSSHLPSDDLNGVYRGRSAGRGEVVIRSGRADTETVQHEIGHHVSRQAGTASSRYDTPQLRGWEEAYADNYAETHHRDYRGRATQITRGPEAWSHREETSEGQDDFRRAFTKMREADAPAHSVYRQPLFPPMKPQAPQQTELLSKFASGRGGEYHWNYGPDAPAGLERQVPGSEEADRRKLRRGERLLDMRGLKRIHSESPRFNHFPSGVVR